MSPLKVPRRDLCVPPTGKATQIVISFEEGDVRRLSGDDADRWLSAISKILVWLEPVKTDAHLDNFSWEPIANSTGVIPLDLGDGGRLYASAVSVSADYVDGMPRQVRLTHRDSDGNEVERQYVQTDERPRG